MVDFGADRVIELDGEGSDGVRSSITYTLENLELVGTADIDGTGNAERNVMKPMRATTS